VKCEDFRAKLTAYLDGELEDDRGSAVRGHLRGCAACRDVARDEAALRDGLRDLPPVDPPASLWAGVQARLAAAEVADAERPAWRRALSRWLVPQQLVLAGVGIAALVTLVVWKTRHADAPTTVPAPPPHEIAAAPPQQFAPAVQPPVKEEPDVTAELAAAPARETQSYAEAAAELLRLAGDARASWSDERKAAFDARVAELRGAIDHASEEHPRQQAYRALIRYLQGAAIRDEVAANDRAFAGGHP
jgi:anti-sigma factor RsiW